MLVSLIKMITFAIALNTVVGTQAHDHERGAVPLEYGMMIYRTAVHHGLDPMEAGAFALAEHRGRDFDPHLTGRFGNGGEAGLFQLVAVWATEAHKRCDPDVRVTKDRYEDKGDCLYIRPGDRVTYKMGRVREPDRITYLLPDHSRKVVRTRKPRTHIRKHKKRGWKVIDHRAGEVIPDRLAKRVERRERRPKLPNLDLFMPEVNIEAGVIAFLRLKLDFDRKYSEYVPDWRLLFRCNPSVLLPLYRYMDRKGLKRSDLARPGRRSLARCEASGRRVRRWEEDLRARHKEIVETLYFLVPNTDSNDT